MLKRPRIIPFLSINRQNLVKTINFKDETYLGDPINAVKIFNEKQVDELCILDIGAAKRREKPDFDYLKDLASEAFMPLSYGGGVTNIEEMKAIFRIGFEKIIINSAAIEMPLLLTEAAENFGNQSVVVSIDVKKKLLGGYSIYTHGGTEKKSGTPVELAKKVEALGAGEILLNSIDNDGTMKGYDYAMVKEVTQAVRIPVIACGGAGQIEHLRRVLYEAGAQAAAAGSLFVYYGRKKAVLINAPTEKELIEEGVYIYE